MQLSQSFGQFLREQGVPSHSLDQAAHGMVVLGGRLGTQLLRSGAVEPERLEELLAEFLGVDRPPADWLEAPDPAAVACLSQSLMALHGALPLRLERGELHVIMRDPNEGVRVEALARACHKRVVPYVVSEVRLAFLQERWLGVPPPGCVEGLRALMEEEAKPVARQEPEPSRDLEALGLAQLPPEAELSDDASFLRGMAAASIRRPSGVSEGTPSPAGRARLPRLPGAERTPRERDDPAALLSRAEEQLGAASDHDGMVRAALAIAGTLADGACLFALHEDRLLASRSVFRGVQRDLSSLSVPLAETGCLAEIVAGGRMANGVVGDSAAEVRLFQSLGFDTGARIRGLPVLQDGRVSSLFVAVYEGSAPGPVAEAALDAVAASIGRTYERMIAAHQLRFRGET